MGYKKMLSHWFSTAPLSAADAGAQDDYSQGRPVVLELGPYTHSNSPARPRVEDALTSSVPVTLAAQRSYTMSHSCSPQADAWSAFDGCSSSSLAHWQQTPGPKGWERVLRRFYSPRPRKEQRSGASSSSSIRASATPVFTTIYEI